MGMIEEIGAYLEAQGVGVQANAQEGIVSIFLGEMQAAPDDCVTLYELKGMKPELVDNIDYPHLQVMTRSVYYPVARKLAETCFTLLHGQYEVNLPDQGGARYLLIQAQRPPYSLGSDKQQRHHLAVDFSIIRRNPLRFGVGP